MARQQIAVQTPTEAGYTPVYTAAHTDGWALDIGCMLIVKNGSGSSINVTVQTGRTSKGRAVADDVIAVPAGAERWIALTDRRLLAREAAPDLGKVWVDFSAVTTVTAAAVSVPAAS